MWGRATPSPVQIGWGAGPPFLLLLLPLPSSPTPTREERSPTPSGSRTPLGRAIERVGPPPPLLLYILGEGAPHEHTS